MPTKNENHAKCVELAEKATHPKGYNPAIVAVFEPYTWALEEKNRVLREALTRFYNREHTAGPQAAAECEEQARAALASTDESVRGNQPKEAR